MGTTITINKAAGVLYGILAVALVILNIENNSLVITLISLLMNNSFSVVYPEDQF